MNHLKPNEKRAKNAIVFIWIVLSVKMFGLIMSYFQYTLFSDVLSGINSGVQLVTQEQMKSNITKQSMAGVLFFIVYVGSAITFISWFRRAYFNLHLKSKYLTYNEGWAAGSWWVPILGWFRPYQIMNEMFIETHSLYKKAGMSKDKEVNTSAVDWWWGFWVFWLFWIY